MKKRIIKIISAILIVAFVAQDVAWANPEIGKSVPSQGTLQIPSFFNPIDARTDKNVLEVTLKYILQTIGDPERFQYHLTPEVAGVVLDLEFDKARKEGEAIIVPCGTHSGRSTRLYEAVISPDRSMQLRKPSRDIEAVNDMDPQRRIVRIPAAQEKDLRGSHQLYMGNDGNPHLFGGGTLNDGADRSPYRQTILPNEAKAKALHQRLREFHHRTMRLAYLRFSEKLPDLRRVGALKHAIEASGIDRAGEITGFIDDGKEMAALAILAKLAEDLSEERERLLEERLSRRKQHANVTDYEKDGKVYIWWGRFREAGGDVMVSKKREGRTLYRWHRILDRVFAESAKDYLKMQDFAGKIDGVCKDLESGPNTNAVIKKIEQLRDELKGVKVEQKKECRREFETAIEFIRANRTEYAIGALRMGADFLKVRINELKSKNAYYRYIRHELRDIGDKRFEKLRVKAAGASTLAALEELASLPFISEVNLRDIKDAVSRTIKMTKTPGQDQNTPAGMMRMISVLIREASMTDWFMITFSDLLNEAHLGNVTGYADDTAVFNKVFRDWSVRNHLTRGSPGKYEYSRYWRARLYKTAFISEKNSPACFDACDAMLSVLKYHDLRNLIQDLKKDGHNNILHIVISLLARTPSVTSANQIPEEERYKFLEKLVEAAIKDFDLNKRATEEDISKLYAAFEIEEPQTLFTKASALTAKPGETFARGRGPGWQEHYFKSSPDNGAVASPGDTTIRVARSWRTVKRYKHAYEIAIDLLRQIKNGSSAERDYAIAQLIQWQEGNRVQRFNFGDKKNAPIEIIIGHLDETNLYPEFSEEILLLFLTLPSKFLPKVVRNLLFSSSNHDERFNKNSGLSVDKICREILIEMGQRAYLMDDPARLRKIIHTLEQIRDSDYRDSRTRENARDMLDSIPDPAEIEEHLLSGVVSPAAAEAVPLKRRGQLSPDDTDYADRLRIQISQSLAKLGSLDEESIRAYSKIIADALIRYEPKALDALVNKGILNKDETIALFNRRVFATDEFIKRIAKILAGYARLKLTENTKRQLLEHFFTAEEIERSTKSFKLPRWLTIHAYIHNPNDPADFLSGVIEKRNNMLIDPEFKGRAPRSYVLYACVHHPRNPRSYLRGVLKIAENIVSGHPEFSVIPKWIILRTCIGRSLKPDDFLKELLDTYNMIRNEAEFETLSDRIIWDTCFQHTGKTREILRAIAASQTPTRLLPDFTEITLNVLEYSKGNQRGAARMLGVSRQTVANRIRSIRKAAAGVDDAFTLKRLENALLPKPPDADTDDQAPTTGTGTKSFPGVDNPEKINALHKHSTPVRNGPGGRRPITSKDKRGLEKKYVWHPEYGIGFVTEIQGNWFKVCFPSDAGKRVDKDFTLEGLDSGLSKLYLATASDIAEMQSKLFGEQHHSAGFAIGAGTACLIWALPVLLGIVFINDVMHGLINNERFYQALINKHPKLAAALKKIFRYRILPDIVTRHTLAFVIRHVKTDSPSLQARKIPISATLAPVVSLARPASLRTAPEGVEARLKILAQNTWGDDGVYKEKTYTIKGRKFTVVYGKDYNLIGDFLFVSPEIWETKKHALRDYKNSIIICRLEPYLIGKYLDLAYHDHTVTTIMELQANKELFKNGLVVDAGSGKDAVLSVLAARLGARRVIAIEREAASVAESRKFLKLNSVEDIVDIEQRDFKDISGINIPEEGISLVVANIDARTPFMIGKRHYMGYHSYIADILKPRNYLLCGLYEIELNASGADMFTGAENSMREAGYGIAYKERVDGVMFVSGAMLLARARHPRIDEGPGTHYYSDGLDFDRKPIDSGVLSNTLSSFAEKISRIPLDTRGILALLDEAIAESRKSSVNYKIIANLLTQAKDLLPNNETILSFGFLKGTNIYIKNVERKINRLIAEIEALAAGPRIARKGPDSGKPKQHHSAGFAIGAGTACLTWALPVLLAVAFINDVIYGIMNNERFYQALINKHPKLAIALKKIFRYRILPDIVTRHTCSFIVGIVKEMKLSAPAQKAMNKISADPNLKNVCDAARHFLEEGTIGVDRLLIRAVTANGRYAEEFLGEFVEARAVEGNIKYAKVIELGTERFGPEMDFILEVSRDKYPDRVSGKYELSDGIYIGESKTEDRSSNLSVVIEHTMDDKVEKYGRNAAKMKEGGQDVKGIIFAFGGSLIPESNISDFSLIHEKRDPALSALDLDMYFAFVPDVVIGAGSDGINIKEREFVTGLVDELHTGGKIDADQVAEFKDTLTVVVAKIGVTRTRFAIMEALRSLGENPLSRKLQRKESWARVLEILKEKVNSGAGEKGELRAAKPGETFVRGRGPGWEEHYMKKPPEQISRAKTAEPAGKEPAILTDIKEGIPVKKYSVDKGEMLKIMKSAKGVLRPKDERILFRALYARNLTEKERMTLRDFLIERNKGLIVSVAKRLKIPEEMIPDAVSEGIVGLMRAMVDFDTESGNKFSTYATWWVRSVLCKNRSNFIGDGMHWPQYIIDRLFRYRRAVAYLKKKLGREPVTAEIARRMRITAQKAHAIASYHGTNTTSLSWSTKTAGDGMTLEDLIGEEFEFTSHDDLVTRMEVLDRREQIILKMYFGMGTRDNMSYSLKKIGRIFRITRERVRQIKKEAIQKMRLANPRTPRIAKFMPYHEDVHLAEVEGIKAQTIIRLSELEAQGITEIEAINEANPARKIPSIPIKEAFQLAKSRQLFLRDGRFYFFGGGTLMGSNTPKDQYEQILQRWAKHEIEALNASFLKKVLKSVSLYDPLRAPARAKAEEIVFAKDPDETKRWLEALKHICDSGEPAQNKIIVDPAKELLRLTYDFTLSYLVNLHEIKARRGFLQNTTAAAAALTLVSSPIMRTVVSMSGPPAAVVSAWDLWGAIYGTGIDVYAAARSIEPYRPFTYEDNLPELVEEWLHPGGSSKGYLLENSFNSLSLLPQYKRRAMMQHIIKLRKAANNALLVINSMSSAQKERLCYQIIGQVPLRGHFFENDDELGNLVRRLSSDPPEAISAGLDRCRSRIRQLYAEMDSIREKNSLSPMSEYEYPLILEDIIDEIALQEEHEQLILARLNSLPPKSGMPSVTKPDTQAGAVQAGAGKAETGDGFEDIFRRYLEASDIRLKFITLGKILKEILPQAQDERLREKIFGFVQEFIIKFATREGTAALAGVLRRKDPQRGYIPLVRALDNSRKFYLRPVLINEILRFNGLPEKIVDHVTGQIETRCDFAKTVLLRAQMYKQNKGDADAFERYLSDTAQSLRKIVDEIWDKWTGPKVAFLEPCHVRYNRLREAMRDPRINSNFSIVAHNRPWKLYDYMPSERYRFKNFAAYEAEDHDGILGVMDAEGIKKPTVLNFDLHRDDVNIRVPEGHWSALGERLMMIGEYIHVESPEVLREQRASLIEQIRSSNGPLVVTICYDYFSCKQTEKCKIDGCRCCLNAISDIRDLLNEAGKPVKLVFLARSQKWVEVECFRSSKMPPSDGASWLTEKILDALEEMEVNNGKGAIPEGATPPPSQSISDTADASADSAAPPAATEPDTQAGAVNGPLVGPLTAREGETFEDEQRGPSGQRHYMKQPSQEEGGLEWEGPSPDSTDTPSAPGGTGKDAGHGDRKASDSAGARDDAVNRDRHYVTARPRIPGESAIENRFGFDPAADPRRGNRVRNTFFRSGGLAAEDFDDADDSDDLVGRIYAGNVPDRPRDAVTIKQLRELRQLEKLGRRIRKGLFKMRSEIFASVGGYGEEKEWDHDLKNALKAAGALGPGGMVRDVEFLLAVKPQFFDDKDRHGTLYKMHLAYEHALTHEHSFKPDHASLESFIIYDSGFVPPEVWREYLGRVRGAPSFSEKARKRMRSTMKIFLTRTGKLNKKGRIKDFASLESISPESLHRQNKEVYAVYAFYSRKYFWPRRHFDVPADVEVEAMILEYLGFCGKEDWIKWMFTALEKQDFAAAAVIIQRLDAFAAWDTDMTDDERELIGVLSEMCGNNIIRRISYLHDMVEELSENYRVMLGLLKNKHIVAGRAGALRKMTSCVKEITKIKDKIIKNFGKLEHKSSQIWDMRHEARLIEAMRMIAGLEKAVNKVKNDLGGLSPSAGDVNFATALAAAPSDGTEKTTRLAATIDSMSYTPNWFGELGLKVNAKEMLKQNKELSEFVDKMAGLVKRYKVKRTVYHVVGGYSDKNISENATKILENHEFNWDRLGDYPEGRSVWTYTDLELARTHSIAHPIILQILFNGYMLGDKRASALRAEIAAFLKDHFMELHKGSDPNLALLEGYLLDLIAKFYNVDALMYPREIHIKNHRAIKDIKLVSQGVIPQGATPSTPPAVMEPDSQAGAGKAGPAGKDTNGEQGGLSGVLGMAGDSKDADEDNKYQDTNQKEHQAVHNQSPSLLRGVATTNATTNIKSPIANIPQRNDTLGSNSPNTIATNTSLPISYKALDSSNRCVLPSFKLSTDTRLSQKDDPVKTNEPMPTAIPSAPQASARLALRQAQGPAEPKTDNSQAGVGNGSAAKAESVSESTPRRITDISTVEQAKEFFISKLTKALSVIPEEKLTRKRLDIALNSRARQIFRALTIYQREQDRQGVRDGRIPSSEFKIKNYKTPKYSQFLMCCEASEAFCEAFADIFRNHKVSWVRAKRGSHDWAMIDDNIIVDLTYGQWNPKYTAKVLVTTKDKLKEFAYLDEYEVIKEYVASSNEPIQFLRNIVDTKELTQNMIEGILSTLFSNKKIVLAFNKNLRGYQGYHVSDIVKALNVWKKRFLQDNPGMGKLITNFIAIEYSTVEDLKKELAVQYPEVDVNDMTGKNMIFTFDPVPQKNAIVTASIGASVRPTYLNEVGKFENDDCLPIPQSVVIAVAREFSRWKADCIKEKLSEMGIEYKMIGIDDIKEDSGGALIIDALPGIKRYSLSGMPDQNKRWLEFLCAV